MMWNWHENQGWGGTTLMIASMLIFWGVLIWGMWTVLRLRPDGEKLAPEQLLAHRFAAGEIDAEAYHRGLDVLANGLAGKGSAR